MNAATERSAIEALHAATAIYTQSGCIERLLDDATFKEDQSLLDPSCGDGAFLAAAIARLPRSKINVADLNGIRGYEIHIDARNLAVARIAKILRDRGLCMSTAEFISQTMVRRRDFLTEREPEETFDLIAGNPPYLRFARWPEHFKALYPTVTPRYALSDLAHAFLDAVIHASHAGSLIAFVTADRWLFNQTAANLREQLGKAIVLKDVRRLPIGSTFERPKIRSKGTLPRVHPVQVILSRNTERGRTLSAAPIAIDGTPPENAEGPCLQDIATVRLAPYLGRDGVFTIDKVTAQNLWDDQDAFTRLRPAVDVENFGCDGHVSSITRFVITTTKDHEPGGRIARHLKTHTQLLPVAKRRKQWWLPPEPISYSDDRPTLLVPRIARALKAVEIPPGSVPINHNLYCIPEATTSLDRVRAILKSAQAQAFVRAHSGRLESGYLDIRIGTVRRIPARQDLISCE